MSKQIRYGLLVKTLRNLGWKEEKQTVRALVRRKARRPLLPKTSELINLAYGNLNRIPEKSTWSVQSNQALSKSNGANIEPVSEQSSFESLGFDERGIRSGFNLEFSLNKRERWVLFDDLVRQIEAMRKRDLHLGASEQFESANMGAAAARKRNVRALESRAKRLRFCGTTSCNVETKPRKVPKQSITESDQNSDNGNNSDKSLKCRVRATVYRPNITQYCRCSKVQYNKTKVDALCDSHAVHCVGAQVARDAAPVPLQALEMVAYSEQKGTHKQNTVTCIGENEKWPGSLHASADFDREQLASRKRAFHNQRVRSGIQRPERFREEKKLLKEQLKQQKSRATLIGQSSSETLKDIDARKLYTIDYSLQIPRPITAQDITKGNKIKLSYRSQRTPNYSPGKHSHQRRRMPIEKKLSLVLTKAQKSDMRDLAETPKLPQDRALTPAKSSKLELVSPLQFYQLHDPAFLDYSDWPMKDLLEGTISNAPSEDEFAGVHEVDLSDTESDPNKLSIGKSSSGISSAMVSQEDSFPRKTSENTYSSCRVSSSLGEPEEPHQVDNQYPENYCYECETANYYTPFNYHGSDFYFDEESKYDLETTEDQTLYSSEISLQSLVHCASKGSQLKSDRKRERKQLREAIALSKLEAQQQQNDLKNMEFRKRGQLHFGSEIASSVKASIIRERNERLMEQNSKLQGQAQSLAQVKPNLETTIAQRNSGDMVLVNCKAIEPEVLAREAENLGLEYAEANSEPRRFMIASKEALLICTPREIIQTVSQENTNEEKQDAEDEESCFVLIQLKSELFSGALSEHLPAIFEAIVEPILSLATLAYSTFEAIERQNSNIKTIQVKFPLSNLISPNHGRNKSKVNQEKKPTKVGSFTPVDVSWVSERNFNICLPYANSLLEQRKQWRCEEFKVHGHGYSSQSQKFCNEIRDSWRQELESERNSDEEILCSICLEPRSARDMDPPNSDKDVPARIRLRICGHVFCNRCFYLYLNTSIERNGTGQIECPVNKCTTIIDRATLATFLTYEQSTKLQHRKNELEIAQSECLQHCPNVRCGTILHLADGCTVSKPSTSIKNSNKPETAKDLACPQCRLYFCTLCNQPAHYPATCSQATQYLQQIAERKEDKDNFLFDISNMYRARVKRCPFCKEFIEKNDGCNQIHCSRCGQYFCWHCLGPWTTHNSHYVCNNSSFSHTIIDLGPSDSFKSISKRGEQLYRSALQWRKSYRLACISFKQVQAYFRQLETSESNGPSLFSLPGYLRVRDGLLESITLAAQAFHLLQFHYASLFGLNRRSLVKALRTNSLRQRLASLEYVSKRLHLLTERLVFVQTPAKLYGRETTQPHFYASSTLSEVVTVQQNLLDSSENSNKWAQEQLQRKARALLRQFESHLKYRKFLGIRNLLLLASAAGELNFTNQEDKNEVNTRGTGTSCSEEACTSQLIQSIDDFEELQESCIAPTTSRSVSVHRADQNPAVSQSKLKKRQEQLSSKFERVLHFKTLCQQRLQAVIESPR